MAYGVRGAVRRVSAGEAKERWPLMNAEDVIWRGLVAG